MTGQFKVHRMMTILFEIMCPSVKVSSLSHSSFVLKHSSHTHKTATNAFALAHQDTLIISSVNLSHVIIVAVGSICFCCSPFFFFFFFFFFSVPLLPTFIYLSSVYVCVCVLFGSDFVQTFMHGCQVE